MPYRVKKKYANLVSLSLYLLYNDAHKIIITTNSIKYDDTYSTVLLPFKYSTTYAIANTIDIILKPDITSRLRTLTAGIFEKFFTYFILTYTLKVQ